jgi:hypothetical protein
LNRNAAQKGGTLLLPGLYLVSVGHEVQNYLAPTIHTTINQFDTMVSSVITTSLGDQSMKDSDQAWVVEHWIEAARVSCKRPRQEGYHNKICTIPRESPKDKKSLRLLIARTHFRTISHTWLSRSDLYLIFKSTLFNSLGLTLVLNKTTHTRKQIKERTWYTVYYLQLEK